MFNTAHTPTHQQITATVLRERDAMIADGVALEEINQGLCETFARTVLDELRCDSSNLPPEVQLMNFEMLQVDAVDPQDFEDLMGLPFDRDKIAKEWPGTIPPEGMTWDDLDAVSINCQLDGGTHTWFRVGDRHYDCETPEGVTNPFDLPLFRQNIETWIDEGRLQAGPIGPSV